MNCKECSGEVSPHRGYIVCTGCGLVQDRHFVETIQYDKDGNPTSAIINPLGTTISKFTNGSKDISRLPNRLRHYTVIPRGKERYYRTRQRLFQAANTLGLRGRLAFDAESLLKRHLDNVENGESTLLAMASILSVVRQHKMPITVLQVIDVFGIDKTKMSTSVFLRFLGRHPEIAEMVRVTHNGTYIPLMADIAVKVVASRNGGIIDDALRQRIIVEASKLVVTIPGGASPQGKAAACVYAVSRVMGLRVPQRSFEPHVTEVTVRGLWQRHLIGGKE